MVNQRSPKITEIATRSSTPVAKKPRRKFAFTKKLLDKLPVPTNGQRAYFYDLSTRGLTLAVSPTGKKVFVLYRKIAGRPERVNIGPYPDLTIEQARGEAARMNGEIARGQNPASRRRTIRAEATLGELLDTWIEHHAKLHTKTWAKDKGMFDLHLHSLKLRKISDIRRMDIVNLHARVGAKSGHYAANRLVQRLGAVFSKAIEWGWEGENPAIKVKMFGEKSRARFLQPEELPAFFEALSKELNETMRDYMLICLLTGARRSNVQAMRWEEINWQSMTWRIPETKSGETVMVALSPSAMSVLQNRNEDAKSQWVFPGKGKSGHLVEPKSAWRRILKSAAVIQVKRWLEANPGKTIANFSKEFPDAGYKDLRLHDLRRTLGSWQAATGASLPIIGKSLGHKSLGATQVYARLNLDPVRESVNRATDALMVNAPAGLLGNGNG